MPKADNKNTTSAPVDGQRINVRVIDMSESLHAAILDFKGPNKLGLREYGEERRKEYARIFAQPGTT